MQTLEGKITGIAVSKAGVTRYAIGGQWYAESDLALNVVVDPVKEAEPAESKEPVKLYCVKSYKSGEWFTKGNVYETDANNQFTTDDGYHPNLREWMENWTFGGGLRWRDFLVPLVKRPAKVGEWVYITKSCDDRAEAGCIYKVAPYECDESCLYIVHPRGARLSDGAASIGKSKYLVLDGYRGKCQ